MPRAVRKLVLSPTRLRIFLECPAQYRLEYVDKLGRFYHRPRAGFSFGHSLHRTLETFHAAGGAAQVSLEELTATLERSWMAQGYQSEEQESAYRQEAQRLLEAYHRAAVPAEAPAATLLYAEKTLRADLSAEIALSGRVDRVDEHADGSLEIVDYKSGRETVSEDDIAGSLAMGIYQLLLHRLHPDRRIRATLVALRTGASASHEQSADEREELEAQCLEWGEAIRDRDWNSVLPVLNDHCPHCDFQPYCQRYWRRQGLSG